MKGVVDVGRVWSKTSPLTFVLIAMMCAPAVFAQDRSGVFGPCGCEPRGTLFQWSYGTSFSGGPDLDEPIVTDRPDFTEASVTVGRGVTQVEMGYTYVNDRAPGASLDAHTYPEILLRQGLFADWFEFRLGWSYLNERETVGNVTVTNDRSTDLLVGAKLALTPQEIILPEMAIIPQLFLPISSDPVLGGGEVLPAINWSYSWELSDRLVTGGNSQLLRALDDETGDPYLLFTQSWTVGAALTDCVGAYTEWFALVPDGADTTQTVHFFNGGFTYLFTDNVQFDIRAGLGLSDGADDCFAGLGLSVRFP